MEMKGFLFFCGSLLRWPAQRPGKFLYFHLYILIIYLITYVSRAVSLNASYFLFTAGVLAPILYAIYRGLPLDCLDYKSAIDREYNTL